MIAGCLRNDRRYQQALFEAYSGSMLLVCQRYARDSQQAEDMLQQAFIRVFSGLKQYRGEGSFEGWIRRIVVHAAIRTLQQEARSYPAYPTTEEPINGIDPVDALDYMESKEIMEMIQQLPDGYRLVLNLYVFEGLTHEEIAGLLGIAPGTSRSQLAKARKALQVLITERSKIMLYEQRRV